MALKLQNSKDLELMKLLPQILIVLVQKQMKVVLLRMMVSMCMHVCVFNDEGFIIRTVLA